MKLVITQKGNALVTWLEAGRGALKNDILVLFVLPMGIIGMPRARAQDSGAPFHPVIQKTWDDSAMATLEVPLADPAASPKHVPADYYYRIPVRPIYKQYPIYAPGREPRGYMEWLERQDPVIVWDDRGHAPPLQTEADWIRAARSYSMLRPSTAEFFRWTR